MGSFGRASGETPEARGWSPDGQRILERLVFPARHLGILGVCLAIPFATSLGDRRLALEAATLLVLLPVDFLFERWTRRHGRFPAAMPVANQVLCAGVVLVAPDVLPAALLLLLADGSLTALIFGRAFAARVALLGTALLAGTAGLVETPNEVPLLLAWFIAALTTAFIVGTLGQGERDLAARYGALVGEVDVIVWEMVPGTNRFSYVSPAAEHVLGYPVEDWYLEGFWTAHLHIDDASRVIEEHDDAIARGRNHTLEYRMVAADGRAVHLRDVASVSVDAGGRAALVRGVMMDITDRRRAEDLLRQRATHDSLTGLPNRALFTDRLDQATREAKRTGDRLALLLLDLDDFKEVNDALGHDAGDRLLAAFAHRMSEEVRECDTIARLGGDEFGLLLTVDADEEGAVAVARRVLAVAERPFEINDLHLQTGASIGIALYPDHAPDPASLTARADIAMYLAKRSGQGLALYEPELDRSSIRRLTLLGQLRQAIEGEQLDLDFQPCFDLRTGQVVSVEALVRWDHPEHGRVGPDDFIRLAEMSGLIQPLTRWVVARAVDLVATMPAPVQVSVNLSVRNLQEPDLTEWLGALVARSDLQPGQLVVELTESEVMTDIVAASDMLAGIRALGVGVAIDDFGAGQSALAYLRSLDVDELKIDRALVTGVGTDPDVATICAAVIDLAHRLGLRVVAEGAADAHDVQALRRMGCDRAQGHFLGTPIRADQLPDLATRSIGDALSA